MLHENAGRDHVIGIKRTGLDQMLDFGDGDATGRRHHGVEVPRGPSIHKVSDPIAFPGAHERKIGANRGLEHIVLSVDQPSLLPFRDNRPVGRRREKAADAGAAGANALGKRALRHELDFQFAAQILPLELLVLANIGRHHLPHLVRLQQDANAEIVHARVVADDGQIPGAARVQGLNEVFGNPAEPEAAHQNRRTVGHERHGGFGAGQHFIHVGLLKL